MEMLVSSCIAVEWLRNYRPHTPHLQNIKGVSLRCMWNGVPLSIFILKREGGLSIKGYKTWFKYKQALKEHSKCCDVMDLIFLNSVDDSNKWLLGEMDQADEEGSEDELIFDADTLN
ncbi:hypothetical protein CR513_41782, partial [Mucuna pruriens]